MPGLASLAPRCRSRRYNLLGSSGLADPATLARSMLASRVLAEMRASRVLAEMRASRMPAMLSLERLGLAPELVLDILLLHIPHLGDHASYWS